MPVPFCRFVHGWHDIEKHGFEMMSRFPRFIENVRASVAQLLGLPQESDMFFKTSEKLVSLWGIHPHAVKSLEGGGNIGEMVENRTAGYFGRVSGYDGNDLKSEKCLP